MTILEQAAANLGYRTTNPINSTAKAKLATEVARLEAEAKVKSEYFEETRSIAVLYCDYEVTLETLRNSAKIHAEARPEDVKQALIELQTTGSVSDEQKYRTQFSKINTKYGISL